MVVDIKDAKNMQSCIAMKNLINQYNRHDTTIVGTTSFTDENIDSAFDGHKKPLRAMPMQFGLKMYLAYFVGLLPFMKIPYDLAAMPHLTRAYTERKI